MLSCNAKTVLDTLLLANVRNLGLGVQPHSECWNLRIGWQPSFRSAEKLVLSNHFIELEGVLAIIESEYYKEQLTLSLRIELAFKRRSE